MAVSALRTLFGRFFDTAFGYAVGGAASSAIDPIVNPLAEQAWSDAVATGVGRALQPADLANMAVQGVLDEQVAAGEAAKSGLTKESFHRLFLVNGSPIAPDQALDLWNRGEIAEADVDRALLQSRLKPEWVETFKLLRRQLVQVADLAEMVVQGVLDTAAATERAQQLGLQAADFARLIRLAGNPPGPESLLAMWNRGILDEAAVDVGLVQSRLKPEWVERFKQLRTQPASLAAAVSAVVKERIPLARGEAIARENGIDAQTFALLVDEGGRPISITEALQLLRRRKIDETRFREVVARSDVKTEFTGDLLNLKEQLPSLAQMRAIIGTGSLSDAVARDTLQRLGYSDAIVDGIIAAGHGDKLAGTKDLAQSAIVAAYQSRQMSRDAAVADLAGLGYDTNDAGVLLGLADYNRAHAYRTAVIGVVKARYLAHDIDESVASSTLDSIGLAPDERDDYLALWTFDIAANPHLLTLAQLNAAVKANILDVGQYKAYLPRLGYVEPEVSILVGLYAGG